jgi:uncharacterized protein
MKLVLSDFKDDVQTEVHCSYNPKDLDLEFVDLKYTKDLELEGVVEKNDESLSFQGHLVSDIEQICGRCLKAIASHVDQSFELFYDVKGLNHLDATNDIREVLIINHPLAYLCNEACKGLCPYCGINLNEQKCQCKGLTKEDSPFKILERLKEDKKNGTS